MRKLHSTGRCFESLRAALSATLLLASLGAGSAWAQGAPSGGPQAPGGAPPPDMPPPGMPAPEVDRSADCDSGCLRNEMDRYLAAWAARDPAALQVTPTLRATENGHAVALGDNAWKTIVRLRPQKIVFTDPVTGQVMALGVLEMRAAEPFIYSVRLKMEKGRIAESETMVTSDKISGQHFRPDLLDKGALLLDAVPAKERLSRAELIKAARVVWGLDAGTPPPTAENCQHYENFEKVTAGNVRCRAGAGPVPARGRRIPLVDVEKGVVVKYQLEDVNDPPVRNPTPGEPESRTPVFYQQQLSFYHLQLAKFADGKYQADALFMNIQPHGLPVVFRR